MSWEVPAQIPPFLKKKPHKGSIAAAEWKFVFEGLILISGLY